MSVSKKEASIGDLIAMIWESESNLTTKNIIALITEYCKLPDPPAPGNEFAQGELLDETVACTVRYFEAIPEVSRTSDAEYLIYTLTPKNDDLTQEQTLKFDVARSIIQTALNRAR